MDRPLRPVNALPANAAPPAAPPPADHPARRVAALGLAALLALPGCSFFQAPEVQRGNRINAEQLQALTPGVQTRQDVQTLLGSPTQTSTFNDNVWYYISNKTRSRPGRQLSLSDQQTVVLTFDGAGVLRTVQRLGEDDLRPVEMVSRETPTPGNERTLLQALFGNIGRIGPGATTGQGGGGLGPGAQAVPGPGTLR